MDDRKLSFETLAIHAGQSPGPDHGRDHDARVPHLDLRAGRARAFTRATSTRARRTPRAHALQDCLAALEGARHGLAFASGLAATDAILHLLEAGDHVVASDDVYGGTFRIFDKVFRRHGLSFSYVDMSDPANVERALTPRTRLVWIESPTNPMLKIVDLAAVAAIARAHGAPDGRRQHVRDAVLPAPARPRDRRRRPLDDEVPERPLRRDRRRGRDERPRAARAGSSSCRTRSGACRRRSTASSCCAG